jgi:hypothetical protein
MRIIYPKTDHLMQYYLNDDIVTLRFDYGYVNRSTLSADTVYANCRIVLTFHSSFAGKFQ